MLNFNDPANMAIYAGISVYFAKEFAEVLKDGVKNPIDAIAAISMASASATCAVEAVKFARNITCTKGEELR